MSSHKHITEIASQQVVGEDASVFSVQWLDLPSSTAGALSARELLHHYLDYLNKCTLTLVRPVTLESGIEFRLLGTRLSLISFLPPLYKDDFAILFIRGGFLVQPHRSDRGEFRFGVERLPLNVRISLQLSDYCPSILGSRSPSPVRFWLYRTTQAVIHRVVTVRFLALLYRMLSGPSAGVRIVNVAVRPGKPV